MASAPRFAMYVRQSRLTLPKAKGRGFLLRTKVHKLPADDTAAPTVIQEKQHETIKRTEGCERPRRCGDWSSTARPAERISSLIPYVDSLDDEANSLTMSYVIKLPEDVDTAGRQILQLLHWRGLPGRQTFGIVLRVAVSMLRQLWIPAGNENLFS